LRAEVAKKYRGTLKPTIRRKKRKRSLTEKTSPVYHILTSMGEKRGKENAFGCQMQSHSDEMQVTNREDTNIEISPRSTTPTAERTRWAAWEAVPPPRALHRRRRRRPACRHRPTWRRRPDHPFPSDSACCPCPPTTMRGMGGAERQRERKKNDVNLILYDVNLIL
jgi:hypothetical protein